MKQFRPRGEVCYYWASSPRRHVLSQLNQPQCTMWETAGLFAVDLLLPGEVWGTTTSNGGILFTYNLEAYHNYMFLTFRLYEIKRLKMSCCFVQAAGPLFFALIDSFNHTRNMLPDSGMKYMSVMVTIISFFRQGFRYLAGMLCCFRACIESTIGWFEMAGCAKGFSHDMMYI
jgi:hypothetical protein